MANAVKQPSEIFSELIGFTSFCMLKNTSRYSIILPNIPENYQRFPELAKLVVRFFLYSGLVSFESSKLTNQFYLVDDVTIKACEFKLVGDLRATSS